MVRLPERRREAHPGFGADTHHLAPFPLTQLLIGKLTASRATVIQTSSAGSRLAGPLDLSDLDNDRHFTSLKAYNGAKLENILFTRELHRRYHDQGISAVAFHPGNIATSFGSQTDSHLIKFIATNPVTRSILLTSPDKGAAELVRLAEGRPDKD